MKLRVLAIMILIAAATAGFSQSGRVVPGGNGRPNTRTPEPTPTPVVAPVSEAADVVDDGDVIKVETQLVSVPVRVMDKKGRFAGGLAKENFRVFEDGVEQQISLFSNENEPFTVALVLDMSYSTTFKIAEIQSAAIAFIAQLRPQDKVMVISFDQEVHMLCEATGDRNTIYQAIKRTKISTGTSLYEAVDLTINDRMRRVKGRKAIILFTDGVDTTSRRVHDLDNLNDAMELDSLIYTIRYDTFADVQQLKGGSTSGRRTQPSDPFPSADNDPMSTTMPTSTIVRPGEQGTTAAEYQRAEQYLDQLALRTGGRLYQAKTLGNLADAYSKIASELREFYSIGYYPLAERVPEKRTSVKVRVDRPGLVVRSRDTYVVAKKRRLNK